MRLFQLVLPTLVLMTFTTAGIAASQSAEPPPDNPEAVMRAEIGRLESQLKDARQTISALKSELEEAREGLAAMQARTAVEAATEVAESDTAVTGAGRAVILSPDPVVPASITQLKAEELALGGVEDISRLEYLVPGLRYGQTGHDARFSMRGSRTNSIGPEADSVVGIYEDGVYIPTSTARVNSVVDIERIDVLRGPQVTTFGQHAYAGAISIVTNKPKLDELSGYAEAENSIPDKTRWRAALNVPLGDTLAVRIAGLSESRSGWINNQFLEPDSDDLNDRKEQTLRTSLYWQPTDHFNILLWRRYQDENGTGTAPWGYQQLGAYVGGQLIPGHQFAPDGFTPDTGPWDVYRNFISATQYEHELNTLDLNWNVGPVGLRWLSNFRRFEGDQTYDSDYSDKGESRNSAFAGWNTKENNWSSELRLSSLGEGLLDWLVGVYWSDRKSEWGWLETINGTNSQPDWDVNGEYSVDTKAAFAQASYPISERFILSGGLRWNKDSKTLKTGEKDSWDKILWKGALQFDVSEQLMTYLSVSSGYLPGGINSAPGVIPRWEPEQSTAFEAGLKSVLADGELLMNLAAWYNDFEDVQSQSFLVMPFPGSPEATEYTGNGGSAQAKGIEAEIQWSPMPEWNLAANLAYTDATFGDYVAANLAGLGDIPGHSQGDQISFKGWHPALTPKWVIGLRTSYTFRFEKFGSLTPYLQSTYASDYYASDFNLAGARQGAQTRTDFRLIWQPLEHFQVQFYILNYGEKETLNWARVYNPAARPEITTLQGNWKNPKTQGILLNFDF